MATLVFTTSERSILCGNQRSGVPFGRTLGTRSHRVIIGSITEVPGVVKCALLGGLLVIRNGLGSMNSGHTGAIWFRSP